MRRAVLTSIGTLQLMTEATDEMDNGCFEPGNVILAVEVCGVCRTDRKAFYTGQRDLKLPRVLGHEIVGRVTYIDQQINIDQQIYTNQQMKGPSIGDRVQVSPGIACGCCRYCLSGNDQLCENLQIIGFHLDGGFADQLYIKNTPASYMGLNLVPEHLTSQVACLTEPLACCLNMQKRLPVESATTVVIFGAGPAGVLNALLARHLGADRIVIVEPHPDRRTTAALVSDLQLDFDGETVSEIYEYTAGQGADIIIPCCPDNAALLMGLEIAAKRSHLGFFSGLVSDSGSASKSTFSNAALNLIHYKEMTVVGSYGCSTADNREALELLAAGSINIYNLPTQDISWNELPTNLADRNPHEHVFTFFYPHSKSHTQKAR